MRSQNPIHSFNKGKETERWHIRLSSLLALIMVFSLAALAVYPAAAQTETPPVAPEAATDVAPEVVQGTVIDVLPEIVPQASQTQGEAPQAGWNIQLVEDPPYFTDMTDRMLRFDGNGYPHIAFGGDHLYYARWNPSTSTWFITIVDPSPHVGRYASIAVDSLNNPRIAYYDEVNGALKFAYSQNGGYNWNPPFTADTFGPAPVVPYDPENPTIEQAQKAFAPTRQSTPGGLPRTDMAPDAVTLETGVGGYTSVATDSQNRVHISYYDWTNGLLKYALWDGVNWSFSTVDGNPATDLNVGKFSSIAVDSNGFAHISYLDEKYDGLKYAFSTGTGWSVKEIDTKQAPNYRFGGFTSLALDSNGNPFISYQDWQNNDLKFAKPVSSGGNCGPGGSWKCDVIDNSGDTGFYTSIARFSSSNMVISYRSATGGALRLAKSTNNGGSWSKSTIVDTNDTGYFSSVALNSSGYAGIAYYSAANGLLSFIQQTSGNVWNTSNLVYAGDLSPNTSLAIGSINIPNVSYFNDTGDQLRLAASVGYGFALKTVANNGSGFTSVKLTQIGEPRIAYYNLSTNNLTYAYRVNGVWYFQTVDSQYGAGMYPSLALDSADRPYISYYDGAEGKLKFAYWNGTVWIVQTVDASADVGMYSSLTLSKNSGNCYSVIPSGGVCPMISYFDNTHKTLKHAFLSQIGAWAVQIVDNNTLGNPANVGQYSSIALDYAGALHISYYDATYGFLKHAIATKGASAWSWSSIQIVDNTANVGQFTSTAASTANIVYVSYYDVTNGHLKMATLSGGIWSSQVVDGNTNTGQGTSVAVFTDGSPAISYFDVTNGSIKFATTYTGLYGRSNYLPLVLK